MNRRKFLGALVGAAVASKLKAEVKKDYYQIIWPTQGSYIWSGGVLIHNTRHGWYAEAVSHGNYTPKDALLFTS